MKNFSILLLMFLAFGCKKECEPEVVIEDHCDYHLGKYSLHQDSPMANVYQTNQKVIFVDSLGNSLRLNVINVARINQANESTLYFYNYEKPGDTVMMCYNPDILLTSLESDDKQIKFIQTIQTFPNYSNPTSGQFSDKIDITINDPINVFTSYQVFTDIVHVQNNTNLDNSTILIPTFIVHNRTFKDVKYNKFENTKNRLWFNKSEGIVAFIDHNKKLWRFERVE